MVLAVVGMLLIALLPIDNNTGRLAGYYLSHTCTAGWMTLLSLISSNIAGYTKKTTLAALFTISYCVGSITGELSNVLVTTHTCKVFRPAHIPARACTEIPPCRNHHLHLLGHLRFRSVFYLVVVPQGECQKVGNQSLTWVHEAAKPRVG